MNYAIYIYITKKQMFRNVPCSCTSLKVFWHVFFLCIINRYFEYRIRILCIFLYMGTYFEDFFRQLSTPKIELFDPPKS